MTLSDVQVKVLEGDRFLLARRGGFLFAHFGLSGPAPLDVSRAVSRHPDPKSLQLELDFLPSRTELAVDEFLRTESLASGKKQLAVVLSELLPRRLCDTLLALAGQPIDRKAAGLSKPDRQKLVQALKRLRVPLRGTLGFEKAEVTSGGVCAGRSRFADHGEQAVSRSIPGRRDSRPRRADRRLQLPGRLEHRLARRAKRVRVETTKYTKHTKFVKYTFRVFRVFRGEHMHFPKTDPTPIFELFRGSYRDRVADRFAD